MSDKEIKGDFRAYILMLVDLGENKIKKTILKCPSNLNCCDSVGYELLLSNFAPRN